MPMYLGIDYGRAHVGLAYAERDLATPLGSLANHSLTELIAKLKQLCEKHHIDHIVCGLPEGELKPEIESFAKALESKLALPVDLYPETLSSQEAITKLHESGASRKKLGNDHTYAAILILEDYLDHKSMVS